MTPPTADVPCDGCTACCHDQTVVLHPELGDDLAFLSRHIDLGGKFMLENEENGDCVYLQNGGCSVWEHRPVMCRAFDCRRHFRSFTRSERRRLVKAEIASQDVFDAGRERLHTLNPNKEDIHGNQEQAR